MSAKRIAVAMSGGLDSSMTAALLVERGYSVLGLTMQLWREPGPASVDDAVKDARAVCAQLGIPHQVIDLRQAFYDEVVRNFLAEYARGRTPNPCLRCNRACKFGVLLRRALDLGYDKLATGHYARIEPGDGGYRLLCAVDGRKDQSYFLYALNQEQLSRLQFPLGGYTKAQVRALAEARGLLAAHRPESQDVCFLSAGDYRRFLREYLPAEAIRPGPIYNRRGERLGEHQGLPFYTVGQREGLGIAAPRPLYVMALDVTHNALIVGASEELGRRALLAEGVSYVSGQELPPGEAVEAKIRYRARRVGARVWALPGEQARVVLDEPLRDVAPGQTVVFYRGDEVLGGGMIAQTLED